MNRDPTSDAQRILETASDEVRRAVLSWLRGRYPIHPLEGEWRVPAEVILEAISRSPDLSKRGVRGLIAEAFFDQIVTRGIRGWKKDTPPGNHAYDCLLTSESGTVRVQVKTQRRKAGKPMFAAEAMRRLSANKYVVETQKTRAGKGPDGKDTRPYRFEEFDILAVNMEPSTNDWTQFRYTLSRWLIPSAKNAETMLKFQPVSAKPDNDWTDSLETAIGWFLADRNKTIAD
ncbi:MAG: hypothetical protein IT434_11520 [Phycisphaerales bacterium]|nr:hypothetical protein [Phycisphaerales bacterium]